MRIALVAALVLTSGLTHADEGQWQPYQMPSIADKLQQRGIDIPAKQLADLGQYPMNAVVSLGYCTASFVSPQGLVVTNHHCAYRGIQYNSKKEHNYLANGFLAHTQEDEPSAGPNERLYITEEVVNVTDKVLANLSDDPLARFENIQANSKALVKECEIDTNYRCEVDDFHHGLEYYLTKKLIIRDVRLVYAPPETIGGFGGDIDNYEYPRHSGDFTFLRAYVGKDGKPATFNKDNVPYQPKSYLSINADGVKAGDGIFVAGYPGSTSRYNLTSELQFASDWIYPTFAKRYQLQIDTVNFMGAVDKDIALKYAGTMASMANRMKKLNGLLDGFNATDIVGIKQQRENDFLAWLKQDPDANQNIISDLEALIAEQHQQMQKSYFYKNAQSSELLNAASKLYRLAKERKKPNDQREPGYQLRDMKMFKAALRRIDSSFDPTVDKTLWLQDLQAYVRQQQRNKVFDKALSITDNFEALEAKVEALYALTDLTDQTKRLAWMKRTALEFETSEDPFIRLAVAIHDTNMALEKKEKILEGKLSSARPEYMKAIIDYYKSNNWPVYPDANRTLRITYGMVDGYLSKDATYKQPFTRLEGLLAKHTGKEPYNVPPKLLKAIKSGDLGSHRVASVYKDLNNCQFMSCLEKPADFNSVPVNFLSSADTTGGNSGSPVFNGRGELVGLNFDSTYEAITKDWFFNPTITRAVHVDIRYILWMMDKVDHADNLIKELSLTRNSDAPPMLTPAVATPEHAAEVIEATSTPATTEQQPEAASLPQASSEMDLEVNPELNLQAEPESATVTSEQIAKEIDVSAAQESTERQPTPQATSELELDLEIESETDAEVESEAEPESVPAIIKQPAVMINTTSAQESTVTLPAPSALPQSSAEVDSEEQQTEPASAPTTKARPEAVSNPPATKSVTKPSLPSALPQATSSVEPEADKNAGKDIDKKTDKKTDKQTDKETIQELAPHAEPTSAPATTAQPEAVSNPPATKSVTKPSVSSALPQATASEAPEADKNVGKDIDKKTDKKTDKQTDKETIQELAPQTEPVSTPTTTAQPEAVSNPPATKSVTKPSVSSALPQATASEAPEADKNVGKDIDKKTDKKTDKQTDKETIQELAPHTEPVSTPTTTAQPEAVSNPPATKSA